MIEVNCSGTPYEIGHQHGTAAREQVHGSKAFYTDFFKTTAKLEWDAVCDVASRWMPLLEKSYPQYVDEMRGIADATELPLSSIIALNVRTEVAFGMYSDGCTSLAFHSADVGILAQNWDWKGGQGPNLIRLNVKANDGRPAISIITEAGIIGKIGLSSAGLGVCLNAITALGVSPERLPVHIALRAALDWSGEEKGKGAGMARRIADRLEKAGVASAGHILLADADEAFGLETSYIDIVEVRKHDVRGGKAVLHSNHYVEAHPGVKLASNAMLDSPARLDRIETLIKSDEGPVTEAHVAGWLCDECDFPASICRDNKSLGGSETLFRIIMDLRTATAKVKPGKPTGDGETFVLAPK